MTSVEDVVMFRKQDHFLRAINSNQCGIVDTVSGHSLCGQHAIATVDVFVTVSYLKRPAGVFGHAFDLAVVFRVRDR